jgi:hypothetical protein
MQDSASDSDQCYVAMVLTGTGSAYDNRTGGKVLPVAGEARVLAIQPLKCPTC